MVATRVAAVAGAAVMAGEVGAGAPLTPALSPEGTGRKADAPRRACLVNFGSAGDVHPMLAMGQVLQRAGWEATVVTNPHFASAVTGAGLRFAPAGEAQHYLDTIAHPKLWDPIDGFGVMWRYLLRPALAPTFERLREFHSDGGGVVIASPVAMGARVAQERLGLPLVTAYTAATMLRSVRDPLTIASWRVPPWLPRMVRQAAWRLLDRHKLQPLVLPALEALRGEQGLPPLRRSVFGDWMHSPQAGVLLMPDWFAPPAADWPAQVKAIGFPMFDEPTGLDPMVDDFVASGEAPIVFMPGTARREPRAFFAAAFAACAQLGRRGLLLGDVPGDLLQSLPASVAAFRYAPFAQVLPRALALVHHGGIGTTAQALRAGIPQVVVPSGYDQFDNGMRLERLGVAREVRELGGLQAALASLLADPVVRERADACSARLRSHDFGAALLQVVETL